MKKLSAITSGYYLFVWITTVFVSGFFCNLKLWAENNQTKDWSVVATYTIPGKASGLASDGTYIYFGIYGVNGDKVYKFDPSTGSNELLFTSAVLGDSYGMTWDGSNLWVQDQPTSSSQPAYAIKFDMDGNVLTQFNLPDHYMAGIAYDNGDFWAATYYPDPGTIYKLDNTGAVLSQIPSPNTQPWGICLEGTNLWVADFNENMLYKIDQTGAIVESHACENMKPSGVVFDGQYLWYVDGQLSSNSTLYKIDLSGAGTPQIEVPVSTYNYGNVSIGDSAVWYCNVYSTGTTDLVVTDLIIPNAVPIFVWMPFPQVIAPGNSIQIPFIYKPTESIPLNAEITVESSDPVNPQVMLQVTGNGVNVGPHILVPYTSHDYGNMRMNATKRWYLAIQNDGNQTLQVTDIAISDPHFYLDDNIVFPLNISVLETAQVGIWFHPEVGTFEAIANISHNDGTQGTIEVSLSGHGIQSDHPMGEILWNYTLPPATDNSVKAIGPIADISADGVSDVIVCSEDYFVRCFNGNSSGTPDLLWENEVGSIYSQNDLCIINDINNDGYEDVAVGLVGGVRAVKVLSGKTGEVLWIFNTNIYGEGGWVYQVSSGFDYNGDGNPDVLASTGNDSYNTGPIRIFCLNGLTGSIIWETYTGGPNFAVIGVPDYTGDGIPDAIGGASNNNETQGKVYGINGLNGSITFTFTTGGSSVWALEQIDDITGDGKIEIIAGDFGGNYYLINPVTGNPVNSGSVGTSILLRFERMDDLNGDGYADITIGYSGTNAVALSGYNGQNIWLTGLADKCWNIDRIEDVSGDGINDLVAGTLYSGNFCYFLDGVDGSILFSENYNEPVDGIGAIPDITDDGSMEMLVGGRYGKLTCFSGGMNSQALSADFSADVTSGIIPLEVHFTDLTLGNPNSWEWDFNNDGSIDSYEENPTYIYMEAGIFTVSLTAGNGIVTSTKIKTDYITADSTVNISEILNPSSITVVPNPFDNRTTISFASDRNETGILTIFNGDGKKINTLYSEKNGPATEKQIIEWNGCDINSTKVDKGIYFGRLITGNKSYFVKIIKR